MTVTVTYLCGHTQKITGVIEQKSAEQAKEQYCLACTEFFRRNGFYPLVAQELVVLQGSEKQVAWAQRLREEKIEMIHTYMQRSIRQSTPGSQEIARARAAFLQVINEQPQARWWIDQRDRAGLGSFAEVYEKAYSEGNHD